jgi:hypothetical protein
VALQPQHHCCCCLLVGWQAAQQTAAVTSSLLGCAASVPLCLDQIQLPGLLLLLKPA